MTYLRRRRAWKRSKPTIEHFLTPIIVQGEIVAWANVTAGAQRYITAFTRWTKDEPHLFRNPPSRKDQ